MKLSFVRPVEKPVDLDLRNAIKRCQKNYQRVDAEIHQLRKAIVEVQSRFDAGLIDERAGIMEIDILDTDLRACEMAAIGHRRNEQNAKEELAAGRHDRKYR